MSNFRQIGVVFWSNSRQIYAGFCKWGICRILDGYAGVYAGFWMEIEGDWLGGIPILGIWVG